MKYFKISLLLMVMLAVTSVTMAAPFRIAVVDLNRALNESEEGIRSKNVLEGEGRQKQQELKLAQEDLRSRGQELQNNLLMTPEAKKEKLDGLRSEEQALVKKSREFENDIRQKERRFTNEIFKELKAVIRTVAKKENFDLVLERTASEVILYMNNESVDLTEKVIDHYNSLKSKKAN